MNRSLALFSLAWILFVLFRAGDTQGLATTHLPAPPTRVVAAAPLVQESDQGRPEVNEILFDTLTAADGLSRSIVNEIHQDQYGFLWFATDSGLNRFDGRDFKIFLPDPEQESSLKHERITALYEDNQGNLWVGTAEGLDRYDPATESFVHYPLVGRVFVSSITEDDQGMIWLSTSGGLKRLNPADKSVKVYLHDSSDPTSLSTTSVTDLLFDKEGRLWVGTLTGLDLLDPVTDSFQHIPVGAGDGVGDDNPAVIQLLEDQLGTIWVNTVQPGLNRLNPEDRSLEHYPLAAPGGDPANITFKTAAYLDDFGRIWIGTNAGLLTLDAQGKSIAQQFHDPDDPRSLADNTILSIFIDRTGLLWVATTGGLSKENPTIHRFPLIQESNDGARGISDNIVVAVQEDAQGDVWIATILGGLNRLDPVTGTITRYGHDPVDPSTISSNEVNTIYEDPQGRLWFGTGAGLDLYNPESDSFTHYHLRGGQAVSAIVRDASDLMIIGTIQGLFSFDEERDFFSTIQGYQLYGNAITDLLLDSSERLWIATREDGLWMATPSLRRKTYTNMIQFKNERDDPTSLGPGSVLSVIEDDRGDIWVGTADGGLNRFHPESQTFTRFTGENGLRGPAVTCIVAGQDDQLWLGTNIGISRFDPLAESFRNYGLADGLQGAEYLTCYQGDDGTMYFGGLLGLNVFDPDQIQDSQHRPPVVITGVEVNEEPRLGQVLAGEHLELPYNQNFIKLKSAVLDFANSNGNQIAYKMDGLDHDWIESSGQFDAVYPDLQPGDYTFRVIGANSDGLWNEEGASLSISITPPFWQTWWFRGSLLLVVLLAAVAWYTIRARNLVARSRQLEEMVAIRTAEVEQRTREVAVLEERQRLARDLHDSVTQSIYSLTLLSGASTRELSAGHLDKVKEYQQRQSQIAQDTLKEMRLLVYQLRPSTIAHEGLITAIQQRLDAVETRSGIAATLETEGDIDLPLSMEPELFNIIQEALNNALKHADPATVSVRLSQTKRRLTLEISDDGCGFDPQAALKFGGLGLESMHERAEQLGGKLAIESQPDQGATIRLEVDIEEQATAAEAESAGQR